MKRINLSVHGTTHEIPTKRHELEELRPIDKMPEYFIIREEIRKISRDCYISYLGNQYSVPYQLAGREATLQILDDKFSVIVGGNQICEHEVLAGNNRVSKNKEHFKGLLGDILMQNVAAMNKSQSILKFSDPNVEKRSLLAYEALMEG